LETKKDGLQASARRVSRNRPPSRSSSERITGEARPSPSGTSAACFGAHAQVSAHKGERGVRFRATTRAFCLGARGHWSSFSRTSTTKDVLRRSLLVVLNRLREGGDSGSMGPIDELSGARDDCDGTERREKPRSSARRTTRSVRGCRRLIKARPALPSGIDARRVSTKHLRVCSVRLSSGSPKLASGE